MKRETIRQIILQFFLQYEFGASEEIIELEQ